MSDAIKRRLYEVAEEQGRSPEWVAKVLHVLERQGISLAAFDAALAVDLNLGQNMSSDEDSANGDASSDSTGGGKGGVTLLGPLPPAQRAWILADVAAAVLLHEGSNRHQLPNTMQHCTALMLLLHDLQDPRATPLEPGNPEDDQNSKQQQQQQQEQLEQYCAV
ncbi:hypothetical protein OEZ85_002622 [Tetradesmus obliquus]|uniref:Uncharacterized protein n=1 Tax=Tetradesmus obliquus TaxID=3088 RepID=A0ABY8U295_TETOB|nr:hypothetical protein OEZ85_002622 [Tetradesmus obliquus]